MSVIISEIVGLNANLSEPDPQRPGERPQPESAPMPRWGPRFASAIDSGSAAAIDQRSASANDSSSATDSASSGARAATAAAVAVIVLGCLVIAHAARGLTFSGDDWGFMTDRRGFGAGVFLRPHNEHLSALPIAA
jgi:hypothetical protein